MPTYAIKQEDAVPLDIVVAFFLSAVIALMNEKSTSSLKKVKPRTPYPLIFVNNHCEHVHRNHLWLISCIQEKHCKNTLHLNLLLDNFQLWEANQAIPHLLSPD